MGFSLTGSFLPNTRKLSWPNTPSHIFRVAPSLLSVQVLRGQGLTLTIPACRSTKPLEENAKLKLAQFCFLRPFAFGNFSSFVCSSV
ncbi:hypothetical protein PRUPE_5G033800 [Prunus persica]|uniref:Uncharacterized protein n=1 Tax=Prunus persica TaxID=3760 RepID=A0A251P356_PRUPE|nr:hypothetical protein PRUPE_5G033800 [Prunus persica]